jgi:hypothetical protein
MKYGFMIKKEIKLYMPKYKSEDFKMSAVEYYLTEDVSQEYTDLFATFATFSVTHLLHFVSL